MGKLTEDELKRFVEVKLGSKPYGRIAGHARVTITLDAKDPLKREMQITPEISGEFEGNEEEAAALCSYGLLRSIRRNASNLELRSNNVWLKDLITGEVNSYTL